MVVKKIQPKELTPDLVFRLSLYNAKPDDFIAITDRKEENLLVNEKVTQKDIDGFLEAINFPGYYVDDDEEGKGKFMEYVYKKYGYHTYIAILDAHKRQIEKREKARAKEQAQAIIPLIEKEMQRENRIVSYDEYLNYEIWKHGFHCDKHTPMMQTNYGSVYTFYFGYLMGAGLLKGGEVYE